jgi:hypothetical protein
MIGWVAVTAKTLEPYSWIVATPSARRPMSRAGNPWPLASAPSREPARRAVSS